MCQAFHSYKPFCYSVCLDNITHVEVVVFHYFFALGETAGFLAHAQRVGACCWLDRPGDIAVSCFGQVLLNKHTVEKEKKTLILFLC